MSGALDLSDLDATDISWADGDEQSTGLYAVAPVGSVVLTEGASDGKTCGGGSCGCGGRPISWCCVNCH
ncbi:hypothetical protein ABZ738_19610 [Micromonospora sp. NPDC047793]|uniref:hypothetical protein n=1 Tax=unclassified Micromonospora TaxID=2617518 RepID=UPI0010335A5D|nr:hypothetical protein [Verrucosispora sp. SN26_14.1]TBL39847.1 hypothetical protein EYA84_07735 [Verrucosispora sp. SN26_14.1]